jgi:hypothetical protein
MALHKLTSLCLSHLPLFFWCGSDDLTLIIWDTSADLPNSGSNDSSKWYSLESLTLSSETFASIDSVAKCKRHKRVNNGPPLSLYSLCSLIFLQEASNYHIGIPRPDNIFC